jgi:hypothetical protein
VAHVALPLAVLITIAVGRPARATRGVAVVAAVAILLIPWHVVHLGDLLRPTEPTGRDARQVALLRSLPPGALVISDTPGWVWRAGLRTPDEFVDVSILRIESEDPELRLTADDIVTAARRPDVCAVVRWSGRRFTRFPDLGRRLRAAGYEPRLAHRGHVQVVWVKPDCRAADGGADPVDRTNAAVASRRSRD